MTGRFHQQLAKHAGTSFVRYVTALLTNLARSSAS